VIRPTVSQALYAYMQISAHANNPKVNTDAKWANFTIRFIMTHEASP